MALSVGASTPSPGIQNTTASAARAADGDYKTPNSKSSSVKDTDGDYKPATAATSSSAQSKATSAFLNALNSLKLGG